MMVMVVVVIVMLLGVRACQKNGHSQDNEVARPHFASAKSTAKQQ